MASISVVQTIRTIMKTITEDGTQNEAPPNTEGYVESDTNADTCCLGKSFIVLQYTKRVAEDIPKEAVAKIPPPLNSKPLVNCKGDIIISCELNCLNAPIHS